MAAPTYSELNEKITKWSSQGNTSTNIDIHKQYGLDFELEKTGQTPANNLKVDINVQQPDGHWETMKNDMRTDLVPEKSKFIHFQITLPKDAPPLSEAHFNLIISYIDVEGVKVEKNEPITLARDSNFYYGTQ